MAVVEACQRMHAGSIAVRCVAYSEPNIDANDCFGSRRGIRPEVVDLATVDPKTAAHIASCRDLVKVSDSGELLGRMDALRTGHPGVPSCVYIGEANRGCTTSEGALIAAGFPVEWIEGAGHCQHIDNPRAFYQALTLFIERSLETQ